MTISQRAPVHDVVVDVLCTGRFYDFLEKRDDPGPWSCAACVTKNTQWDPVDPSQTVKLDPEAVPQFPEGYLISPTCNPVSDSR